MQLILICNSVNQSPVLKGCKRLDSSLFQIKNYAELSLLIYVFILCERVCVVSLVKKRLEVEWVSTFWLGVAEARWPACGRERQQRNGQLWKMHSQGSGELGERSVIAPLHIMENPGAAAQRSLGFIKLTSQTSATDFQHLLEKLKETIARTEDLWWVQLFWQHKGELLVK